MAKAGAVWIDVLPNMAGFNTAIRAQMGTSLAGSGAEAGKSYTAGLLRSLKMGLGGMQGEVGAAARGASAAAAAAVEQASAKVAAARAKEETAAGRVRVAELKLQELRAKDNASASSLAAAEERLAGAKRTLTGATEGVVGAERAERLAHEQSTLAAREAAGASLTAGSRFSRMSGGVVANSEKMAKKVGGFGKAVGGMAGLFGAFEVAKFGVDSVKAATEFQKSTSVLVTAAGETKSNLEIIRKGIVNISDDTGTTTDQLSEGMYTIEKAGFRGANGLKILDAAAKGAKEENADLGTVTNAMTSIMNSYGIKTSKSVNVMNALKTAAAGSKTTMENFAGSLSTVLPIAAANKISFANVAGALGTLTSHGTSAQEATQELAFSIRSLSAPNAVAVKEMGQFGISSQDVATHLGKKGLQGTIDELSQTVLKKMGPSGKVLLDTFYKSTSAARSAQQMYDKLSPAQKKLADSFKSGSMSMKDWTKEAKGNLGPEQYNQLNQWATLQKKTTGFNDAIKQGLPGSQTYSEAMKKMMGGATGLNTALMLTGSSADATKKRTDAISKSYKDNAKEVEGWKATQQTAAVAQDRMKNSIKNAGMVMATAFLPTLTKITTGVANFITNLMKFSQTHKWVGEVVKYLALAGAAFTVASIGVWAFNAALDANPVTLIIAGLIALGVGLVAAYKNVSWFHHAVVVAWSGIKVAVAAVSSWFSKDVWPVMKAGYSGLSSAATWMWKNAIKPAWDGIKTAASATVSWFSKNVWPVLKAGFHIAGDAANWLWHNAIQPAWTGIKKATSIWWAGVKTYFSLMYDFITKWIVPIIKFLWHNVWEPAFQGIAKVTMWLWNNAVHPYLKLMWSFIKNVVAPVVVWLYKNVFKPQFELIGGIVKWLWKNVVSPVFGWIGSKAKSLYENFIKPAFTDFKNIIHNGIGPAISWLWNKVASPMFAKIGQGGYNMWHRVLKPVFDTMKSTVKGLKNTFHDAVTDIGKAWNNLESAAKNPVKFVVNSVVRPLVEKFNSVGSKFGITIPEPKKMWTGGYTGTGSKYQSRGLIEVHGNEYVQPTEAVRREGVPAMRALHEGRAHIVPNNAVPGFADGGLVPIIKTVAYALKQVGKPYVWGAAGPNAFDCSGLTSAAWQHGAGVHLTHLAAAQHREGFGPISRSNLFPGDLVFPRVTAGGGIPHVEMYVGNGQVVEAMNPSLGIRGPHAMNGFAGGARRPALFATANASNSGSILDSLGGLIAAAAKKGGEALGSLGGLVFDKLKGFVTKPLGTLKKDFPYPFATKMLPAAVNKLATGAIDWGKSKASSILDFGGGSGSGSAPSSSASRWTEMVSEALSANGISTTQAHINAWVRQIQTESGGNPKAVQHGFVDVNSRSGDYAKGLLQVISATFKEYAFKGHGNIFDPYDNALAAIHYAKSRYGASGMFDVVGHGHGYSSGTLSAGRGVASVAENGAELVLSPQLRNFQGGERVYNAAQTKQILSAPSVSAADLEKAVSRGMNGATMVLEIDGKRTIARMVIDELNTQVGAGVAGVI